MRLARGLSICELARRSGLSHVAISLIERDRSSPSVSSLKAIVDALGTTLSYRQVGRDLSGAAMMILHERYEPGADTGDVPYHHAAEEGGVVVAGRLELSVGDEVSVLGEGDAYYFDSRRPHRMRNPFAEPRGVVSAVSPPTF